MDHMATTDLNQAPALLPRESLVTLTHVIYALHAFSALSGLLSPALILTAFLSGWPSIIAVILNYVKRSDVRGTWLDSHFGWQIRTFWFALLWLIAGSFGSPLLVPLHALLGLVRLVLSGMTGLLIVYAVMSWVRSDSPMVGLIDRVVAPWLRPLRRLLPLVGGVDLSPLVLLVLLQVMGMVQDSVLRMPY